MLHKGDSNTQQPGSIFNNLGAVKHAGRSLLGIMALVATLVVMFYTTASDTMVRPKLQFSDWEKMDLNSTVWASYANPTYVNNTCTTPISIEMDPIAAGESCLAIQYSGDCESNKYNPIKLCGVQKRLLNRVRCQLFLIFWTSSRYGATRATRAYPKRQGLKLNQCCGITSPWLALGSRLNTPMSLKVSRLILGSSTMRRWLCLIQVRACEQRSRRPC